MTESQAANNDINQELEAILADYAKAQKAC